MTDEMRQTLDEIIKVAENNGWRVDTDEQSKGDIELTFYQYSPAGQDFSFYITLDKDDNIRDCAQAVYEYYEAYEPEAETMLWLDSDGHGKNGAPYHMKDLLEDMEACEKMLEDLSIALENYKM